jgi:hypothetical protein
VSRERSHDAGRRASAAILPGKRPRQISGAGLLFVWFGLYLLLGAVVAFSTDQWPFFMPPEVGFIQSILAVFGARASSFLEGSALGITGTACCCFGAVTLVRGR